MIVDTHIHIYPCYRLEQALHQFLDRFASEPASTPPVACLAERFDCHYYDQIGSGETEIDGFAVQEGTAGDSLLLQRHSDQRRMYLLPGRQVISKENIEVLALCCRRDVADGAPAAEIVEIVGGCRGVPVVAWSPGKWFGQRGRVVENLLQHYTPKDFLLGDTSLRPLGWPVPLLMRKAKSLGYRIVHGSDPLPFPGEESRFGLYASRIDGHPDQSVPEELLRGLPCSTGLRIAPSGQRSNPLDLLDRLRKNAASKGTAV